MADNNSACAYVSRDILDFLIKTGQPVHKSICLGKVPCPHNDCGGTKNFFEESGIYYRFRIKHKEQFTTLARNE